MEFGYSGIGEIDVRMPHFAQDCFVADENAPEKDNPRSLKPFAKKDRPRFIMRQSVVLPELLEIDVKLKVLKGFSLKQKQTIV